MTTNSNGRINPPLERHNGAPRMSRVRIIEKGILGFIAGAAAAIGIVEIVLLVQRVVRIAQDPTTLVPGMALTDAAAPSVANLGTAIVEATIDGVTLTITALPPEPRAWLVAAAIAATLVPIGVCAALAWLCVRVFLGRPFVASATWAIGGLAILVLVGGLCSSVFTGIAHSEVAAFLGSDAFPAASIELDLAPLGWAAALAVVAGAFEIGQRMQRDTDGLV